MNYHRILICLRTGELTVEQLGNEESGWLNQYFTRHDAKNDTHHGGTVCLTPDIEKRKKWLVEKMISDAQEEFDTAELKLTRLKKLLK